jgi:GalNAc-alpha-(1->4)-GalNAc-alpha-(1->3)-diNAcBac-PP-undecaprenol alpha-1,4-N-acetyl-D-galactosaminyltransferase
MRIIMKIAFTCNRIGTGGAERVICNFSNRMSKDGIDVRLICLDVFEDFYYPLDSNVNIIQIDKNYKNRLGFFNRKIAGVQNFIKLVKILKEEKPDVVVSFYTRQNCYSILACRMLNIPIIAAERDHFFVSDSIVNKTMRKILYPFANGFIHQTKWARDFLRAESKIICNDIILPNPLWINSEPERMPINKRVIAVGRLAEQKNYKGLINAFKNVVENDSEMKLYIYGEGNQRIILENLINTLGLANNVFLAGISMDVIERYKEADVFVLFSHGEGYPNVLMEALSMGVPSIAANCPVGGPADMIIDGINGFLVDPNDEVSLGHKIITLTSNNSLKKKFSKNATEIRKTNDFEVIYSKLMAYIRSYI